MCQSSSIKNCCLVPSFVPVFDLIPVCNLVPFWIAQKRSFCYVFHDIHFGYISCSFGATRKWRFGAVSWFVFCSGSTPWSEYPACSPIAMLWQICFALMKGAVRKPPGKSWEDHGRCTKIREHLGQVRRTRKLLTPNSRLTRHAHERCGGNASRLCL